MSDQKPVSIGIAGIGGFAGSIRSLILDSGQSCDPPVQLTAVCDPNLEAHAEVVDDLRSRGIKVHDDYEKMLAEPIEGVWLPLPIMLHEPFTEAALKAGKAVMCEKPAAGTVQEVDRMIAARDGAGLPVLIGFQDVYARVVAPLKQRILDGEFGKITEASLSACWPRSTTYFNRNNWAGTWRVGDRWVLDSPANNALSHYINIVLFYLGPTLHTSATPVAVEAELYRAAEIENFDTISARVTLQDGVQFVINLTHACSGTSHPDIQLRSDRATMSIKAHQNVEVEMDGQKQIFERTPDMGERMLQAFARAIRGQPQDDTCLATLEVARQHSLLINVISQFMPIHDVPADVVQPRPGRAGDEDATIYSIPEVESKFAKLFESHQLMHESGLFSFTQPALKTEIDPSFEFVSPYDFATAQS